MGSYELRNNQRRLSDTRRIEDRRVVTFPFGSSAWLKKIQNHYFAWPKFDRRECHRRLDERRAPERRLQNQWKPLPARNAPERILLTQQERSMIQSLFLSDD